MISLGVLKKISSLKYMSMPQDNNMVIYLYVLNYHKLIDSSQDKVTKFNS